MTLHIVSHRKIWYSFSAALVAACVAALILFPLRFGIDFTGGSLIELEFAGDRPATAEIAVELAALGQRESAAQTVGDKGVLVRMESLDEAGHKALLEGLNKKFGGVSEKRFETIGPTVGRELRSKALWSLALVLLGIAAYVAFAFRKVSHPVSSWTYGLITLVAALFHDVLLPLAAFAVLGRLALVEVNSAFIAALLTILGFSVHDTIVVFDRIRENLSKGGGTFEETVEKSISETMARSINTSLSTLLPVLAIYFFGGETLKWFAFALGIGILAGTYSSVFLAAPLLVTFERTKRRR